MKKKMPPSFYVGLGLNMAGIVLTRVMSDWQHNWLPIPVSLLGIVFLIITIVQLRKE